GLLSLESLPARAPGVSPTTGPCAQSSADLFPGLLVERQIGCATDTGHAPSIQAVKNLISSLDPVREAIGIPFRQKTVAGATRKRGSDFVGRQIRHNAQRRRERHFSS